ncbi:unnamed protein product [Darwinula stevensoni]|uniref:All-trans-retinol 13,14-reductase n=1 Tax=Darwinula stevensoni TaxID=69355 RepID=A0A7R9AC16_9CRUS|nr:unnamed protein product [Darwinula stevensoni]CAG0899453.1 unnamed protein product [Darwinula stevensoni]
MLDSWSLALGGLVLILFKILQSLLFRKKRSDRPIFSLADVRPPAPHVADQKLRDKVLKQGFSSEKVPRDLDAIVIGSGIGGLSAAALLAKAGKKVLVLEQHDQVPGCLGDHHDVNFANFDHLGTRQGRQGKPGLLTKIPRRHFPIQLGSIH